MRPVKPIDGSYFFSCETNDRFTTYLNEQLVDFRKPTSAIDWWNQRVDGAPHCTLGILTQNDGNGPTDAAVRKVADDVIGKVPSSMRAAVSRVEITPSGWVILVLAEKKQLQKFHESFIKQMSKLGLQASKYSNANYMAHISVGSLKPGVNPAAAQKELDALIEKLQQKPLPFNIYKISLQHYLQGKNSDITSCELPRMDLGIQKTEQRGNKYIVRVDTHKHAKKLAKHFHKYYHIDRKGKPGEQKKVKEASDGTYTLRLNERQFAKVSGHVHNLK